jgi:hypothetical protein
MLAWQAFLLWGVAASRLTSAMQQHELEHIIPKTVREWLTCTSLSEAVRGLAWGRLQRLTKEAPEKRS